MKKILAITLTFISLHSIADIKCSDIENGTKLEISSNEVIIKNGDSQVIGKMRNITVHLSADSIMIWPPSNNHGGSAVVFSARIINGLQFTYLGAGLGLGRAICEIE